MNHQSTFISYAQSFEDVLLNRVFRDKVDGFYIDIGALHPTSDSVTKAFYNRGWCGINIEPIQEFYHVFCQDRPRDINLNIAVSNTSGELEFFQVMQQPGNSSLDKEMVYQIAQEKGMEVSGYIVNVETLADICERLVNRHIDFIKIDVEGLEEQVILGGDWQRFRPTVLLMECTLPNTNIRCENNIHSFLAEQNYEHVFFDGINDYFLAKESLELAQHFSVPVNVLDFYVDYRRVEQQNHINHLLAMVSELQEKELQVALSSSNRVETPFLVANTASSDWAIENEQFHYQSAIVKKSSNLHQPRRAKIAFDISVLGLGYLDKKARTGVYRVTDYILKGLLNSSDLTVYLCSSLANLAPACREYLKAEFKNIELPLFSIADLKALEISLYHSPFYPIPLEVSNCRKIITIYDLIPVKFPVFFGNREDSLIRGCLESITESDFISCISESTKKDLLQYDTNISEEQVSVIHLAADKNKFYHCHNHQLINAVHQKYNIPAAPYLLSVCTLEPRKNLPHVIRCFLKTIQAKDISDLNLVLVGTPGWQFDEIFAELDQNADLRQRIIFTGFVPDEDLAPLYSDALAFLYLSIYEGFGLPPLEAMQCGTPVITSNTSSLPEVVGEAGIMISPDDINGLCNSIYDLYLKKDFRELLSQKSLEQSEKFTWEKTLQKTIEIYKIAIERKESVLPPLTIIDGVFFQLFQTGIARVWKSLIEEWSTTNFRENIIVLDRSNTAPKIPGIKYRQIPAFNVDDLESDRQMLQTICDEEGADVFTSTYYTTPLSTPSMLLIYDMIPEVLGWNLEDPGWRGKVQAIEQASAYAAISENSAQDLIRFYPSVNASQVTVTHCGVSNKFTPATPAEIQAFQFRYGIQKPYFLITGGHGSYKNTVLFFQAFAQLINSSSFDIVCTSQIPDEFRQFTQGSTVHQLRLNDEGLRLAYAGAVALVYPSKYEGFGLPIVEALACGCPVITCPTSSIPEVAKGAALYVPDQDVDGMLDALCEIQKPSVRQTLINKGFVQAQQFSWAKMARQVGDILAGFSTNALSTLSLQNHNLLMFPDWSIDEELLGQELARAIGQIIQTPDLDSTALLLDVSSADSLEQVELILAGISMNLLMEQDLDISEHLAISPVGVLSIEQWQELLPQINNLVTLPHETSTTKSQLVAAGCQLPTAMVIT